MVIQYNIISWRKLWLTVDSKKCVLSRHKYCRWVFCFFLLNYSVSSHSISPPQQNVYTVLYSRGLLSVVPHCDRALYAKTLHRNYQLIRARANGYYTISLSKEIKQKQKPRAILLNGHCCKKLERRHKWFSTILLYKLNNGFYYTKVVDILCVIIILTERHNEIRYSAIVVSF